MPKVYMRLFRNRPALRGWFAEPATYRLKENEEQRELHCALCLPLIILMVVIVRVVQVPVEEQELCPLCPDDDRQILDLDFFGHACYIDGVRCCSVCYNISCLTESRDDGLQHIKNTPCFVCKRSARWSYDGRAVCVDCMREMSATNSDNEEVFKPALLGRVTQPLEAER